MVFVKYGLIDVLILDNEELLSCFDIQMERKRERE